MIERQFLLLLHLLSLPFNLGLLHDGQTLLVFQQLDFAPAENVLALADLVLNLLTQLLHLPLLLPDGGLGDAMVHQNFDLKI